MYKDLPLSDRARIIQMAVQSGISDLRTIEDVYNKFATGGPIKDLAYKIMTDDTVMSRGNAGIKDIVRAVTRPKKDVIMDDNKYAYLYGTGDRYPEVEEPIQGFDYTNYLNRSGYKGIKNVYGVINPYSEYHLDPEYETLVTELAKHKYHFYDNADEMYLDTDVENTPTGYRDDVANFIHTLDLDEKGDTLVHDSDVYDFNPIDYNYTRGAGRRIAKAQAKLLDKIGTPYIIRQENQPIYFDGAYGPGFEFGSKLDELTDEDIARATNSGLLEPATIQYASGGKIHIKKENRGKFTALKKRTGHSASWFKAHGTPAQRKMATFALNARKWHH